MCLWLGQAKIKLRYELGITIIVVRCTQFSLISLIENIHFPCWDLGHRLLSSSSHRIGRGLCKCSLLSTFEADSSVLSPLPLPQFLVENDEEVIEGGKIAFNASDIAEIFIL